MQIAEQVTFGGSALNRSAELRGDEAAIAAMLADPKTRMLPLWRGKPLVAGPTNVSLATVSPGDEILSYAKEAPVFLGKTDGETPWFAADISGWEPDGQDVVAPGTFLDPTEQHFPGLPHDHRFAELRAVMALLSGRDAELAAAARAILVWHERHGFCAVCGAKSEVSQAGWQRSCVSCNAPHFPRTDPVVIMLITHGNSVLMGRSPGWPEGMYSLLAGFIEPGETMEAAVRREVAEETAVRVGHVDYLASQPWPYPSSLMFGCRGEALSREITIDPAELEDALWISREELAEALAGRHATLLPARKGAIAQFLMENWLADRLD